LSWPYSAAPSPRGRWRRGPARASSASWKGPEVVTDAAKFPKTFKEAPQLAELVKAGKLPPVAERIGQDPLVIKPLKEIGKYGGTWRAGFTGPPTSGTASAAARGRTI
jgi:peptide/nickel transport system substrate-binding protein